MHQPRALRALLLVAVCAGALTGLSAASAPAADDGNTSFAPADRPNLDLEPFFELEVNPGVRVRDRVVLENRSRQRQTYDIYPADATSVDGAFALSGADAKQTGVGAWLQVPVRTVVLKPSESRTFAFVLDVPANATPGDRAGGIVALPKATQAVDSSSNVQLQARQGVGVRVYLRVGGPLHPELTASDLTIDLPGGLGNALLGVDSATVGYQVENSGNVTLAPTSEGQVSTLTSTTDLAEHQFGEMLPGSATVVTEQVDGLRWGSLFGRVHVKVTVTAEGADPVTVEATAWQVPWLLLLGVALLLALAAGFWVIRRRRRRQETVDVEPAAEEPDLVAT
jgi:LPXTG-motif cell wall-anchored protein